MSDPFFTIVVTTRNRPELLRLALESVFEQSFRDFEVILVDDGSDPVYKPAIDALAARFGSRLRKIDLVNYPRGHGQSYALNTGVFAGRGQFVTFLDDDDFWTDPRHLEHAHAALSRAPDADAYYANQLAVQVNQSPEQGSVLWLVALESRCIARGLEPDNGVYHVSVELLMQCSGFPHQNCSILRRELFLAIKGKDEDIRWECDRDLYFRTIDNARDILFNPDVVSQHNVPDKTRSNNLTTAITEYQRRNYQLYVLTKASLLARHPAIRTYANRHRAFVLEQIAEQCSRDGRRAQARYYQAEVMGLRRDLRSLLKYLKLLFRR